jgi:hypothetical protein
MTLIYAVPREHLDVERRKASLRGSGFNEPIRKRPIALKALQGRPLPEDGRVIDL